MDGWVGGEGGYHPVGASSRAPNERRTSRGAGVAESRALARAIIIHSNDDECLYPSGPTARLGELMTRATHGMPRDRVTPGRSLTGLRLPIREGVA
jgi:hypothetical protein